MSARTIVVAYNRLHSLAYAYYHEYEYRDESVEHHDCGNRIVTAVTVERVVDYGVYSRTGYIYKERSHADIKDAFDNPPLQTESSFDEMQSIFFVEEMAHYEECRYKHRNVGGDGGTAYSPVETEEKQRGENSVDSSSDHVCIHRLSGVA